DRRLAVGAGAAHAREVQDAAIDAEELSVLALDHARAGARPILLHRRGARARERALGVAALGDADLVRQPAVAHAEDLAAPALHRAAIHVALADGLGRVRRDARADGRLGPLERAGTQGLAARRAQTALADGERGVERLGARELVHQRVDAPLEVRGGRVHRDVEAGEGERA